MALATLPRVLSPNEIVNLPVTIFAMEDKVKDVKVQVKTNSYLNVQGSSVQNVHFDRVGDKVVNFSISESVLAEDGLPLIDKVRPPSRLGRTEWGLAPEVTERERPQVK